MGTNAENIEQISYHLGRWCNSVQRAPQMVQLLKRHPPEVFWTIFNWHYSGCDNTWGVRSKLLELLRRNAFGVDHSKFMEDEARKIYSHLPKSVQVYRGCSRKRKLGLSWTLDRTVAVRFAQGHRGLEVPNPVVYEGMIPKKAIFTVIKDRDELEVVLDPTELCVMVSP